MRVRHENRLTIGPVRFDPTCRGIADYMCSLMKVVQFILYRHSIVLLISKFDENNDADGKFRF